MDLEGLNHRIDAALSAARPDRYSPGADWLDDVAESMAEEIPIFEARQMAASALVRRREGEATKRVNKMLKSLTGFGRGGQFALPVDWYLYADEPVATEQPDANGNLVRVRIALRAMRSEDWEFFALNGRVTAQHRYDAEMAMYDAAEWLVDQQRGEQFEQWAEAIAPRPTAATA